MLNWLRCFWRRHHVPMRHYLGGFRCAVCGVPAADLSQMGFDGYVGPRRVTYVREHGQITRSSWDSGQYAIVSSRSTGR